jgi:hypothetical protein
MSVLYDFYVTCTCPRVWHGVIPPSCQVHNPPPPGVVWTTVITTPKRKSKKKHKREKE